MTRTFNEMHGTHLETYELADYGEDYLRRVTLLAQALAPRSEPKK